MIVKNPTPNDITVKIEGIEYTVLGNDELKNVPAEHAEQWKNKLHGFLVLAADAKVKEVEAPKPTPDAAPLKSEAHKEVEVKTPSVAPKKK